MAEFHAAPRGRKRRRERGQLARHDTDRGSFQARRQPPWPRLPGRAARQGRVEILHELGLPAIHPPRPIGERGVRRVLKALRKAGGLTMAATTERAILAGGCFWGMQQLVRRLPGVVSTRVGYSGGDVKNATYRNHGTHAEAIEITFDPSQTSFRALLEFFFQIHDPTTLNRQGNDRGASYRSAIFHTTDEQKEIAEDTIADVNASGLWPGKVVTEVAPAGDFWEAEEEHQDYLQKHPYGYTCHYIRPDWTLSQSNKIPS